MIVLSPIATVKNSRRILEDYHWDGIISIIELVSPFTEEALFQIEIFSYAGIIFYFHLVEENKIETGARAIRATTRNGRKLAFSRKGERTAPIGWAQLL